VVGGQWLLIRLGPSRQRRAVSLGDPSLRLKDGCAQDDAATLKGAASLEVTPLLSEERFRSGSCRSLGDFKHPIGTSGILRT